MAASSSSAVRLVTFLWFFFALLAAGSSTAQVPLLMWSSDGLPPLASPAAGHITTLDQLTSYITSAFSSGPRTVLLFLQDKLSKEDFTVFGGVFGNKQDSAFQNLEAALQSSYSSVLLPASEWSGPTSVLTLLQDKLGVSPLLVDADTLSHLSLNTSVSTLLLINLPYCTGFHKSCKDVLHGNDEIIGKVLSIMETKNVPYTAIYTGLQPSRVISEISTPNQLVGRSLLQSNDTGVKPPIIFNNGSQGPCIMLWAQNLNVSMPNSSLQWIDFAASTVPSNLTGSWCDGTNSVLVLNNVNMTLSFMMSQRFYHGSARNWFTLDSVQLQYQGNTIAFSGSRFLTAPVEYSYHCQTVGSSGNDALLVLNSTSQGANRFTLNFVDFQIQGFGLKNGTNFSYASDCASFFTPGIWMGLVTTLILLLILVYGLHMITNLTTMDRFDDPKGPTIAVPQTE